MLDYNDGISAVGDTLENADKLCHVVGMQTRGRLIKDIDGLSRGAFCKLGGELHSLCLTARKGGRGLSDFDISKSDIK